MVDYNCTNCEFSGYHTLKIQDVFEEKYLACRYKPPVVKLITLRAKQTCITIFPKVSEQVCCKKYAQDHVEFTRQLTEQEDKCQK